MDKSCSCLIFVYMVFVCTILIVSAGELTIQPLLTDGKIFGNLGQMYVITCTSTGQDENKPKALQWKFDDGIISDNIDDNVYTKLDGDSLQLYFTQLTSHDSGVYTCSGIEAGQQKEVRFEFVLRKPITFSAATLIKQTLRANREDDMVRCSAESIPGPQISWIRKKMTIRNDEKYLITNDGLRIKNPQVEDEGIYTCKAYVISTGEVQSRDIEVEISTIPKWIQQPQDTEAVRGQDAIIKCDAFAKPLPTIEFRKDGIPIAGERYIIKDSQLTIRRVENFDSATYTCIATNEAGYVEANLRLTVLVGPVIRQFESLVVDENRDANFICQVIEAVPPPTFRWKYADTQQFIDNIDGHFNVINSDMSSELRITNVKKTDRRNFTCVATNKAAISEYTAQLYVRYPPVLIVDSEARNQYYSWFITDQGGVSRGATVLFTCKANGYPEISIKWYFAGKLITESPKYRFLRNDNGYSQLEVTPRDLSDFGVYVCEADNSAGKTQRDIPLLQATAPQYEPTVEKGVVKPDSFMLTIRSPKGAEADGGMPIESYKIQWRLTGVDWSKSSEYEPPVDITSINKDLYDIEIVNLQPDTDYVVRVAAVNKPGVGKYSQEMTIRTKQRRQPDAVKLLNKEDCGYATRCIVEWTPEGNGGSPILEYTIRWRKVFYKDLDSQHKERVGTWSDLRRLQVGITKYEVVGLEPNSFYEVDINARNELGVSASQPYRIKTMQGVSGSEYADPRNLSNLNIGLIIAGSILAFLIIIFTIDLCCYFTNKCGILMSCRNCCCKKSKTVSKTIYKEPKYEGVPQDA